MAVRDDRVVRAKPGEGLDERRRLLFVSVDDDQRVGPIDEEIFHVDGGGDSLGLLEVDVPIELLAVGESGHLFAMVSNDPLAELPLLVLLEVVRLVVEWLETQAPPVLVDGVQDGRFVFLNCGNDSGYSYSNVVII